MPFAFFRYLFAALLLAGTVAACGTIPTRHPLQQAENDLALIPGLPDNARFWGDEVSPVLLKLLREADAESLKQAMPSWYGKRLRCLAISGGGQDGAFGAGLMNGWTAAGDRPEFQVVTGVSTGALSAPFVFLGAEYDHVLRDVYITHSTADLIEFRLWTVIATGDAALDTDKLRKLIASYVDDEMIRRLAVENRRGRRLFIGTTNLDAARPVIWNLTVIADSDYPKKKDLIVDVLLASASIPAAFPPVLIKIPQGDKVYDELHVDGGAVSQVFVYPSALDLSVLLEKMEITEPFDVYVIRNSKIKPDWKPVTPGIFSISKSSIDSMIRTQGVGDLSTIYLLTQRDGGHFNLAYIPDDFDLKPEEQFDISYMKELYDLGYEMGKNGIVWDTVPPAAKVEKVD